MGSIVSVVEQIGANGTDKRRFAKKRFRCPNCDLVFCVLTGEVVYGYSVESKVVYQISVYYYSETTPRNPNGTVVVLCQPSCTGGNAKFLLSHGFSVVFVSW